MENDVLKKAVKLRTVYYVHHITKKRQALITGSDFPTDLSDARGSVLALYMLENGSLLAELDSGVSAICNVEWTGVIE